jgi:hypothetical protein
MMGRNRKIPPAYSFGCVGDTRQETDAEFDRLEQMAWDTEHKPGRKCLVDRYAIASTIAKALPLGPQSGRLARKPPPLPKGCLGTTPVRAGGVAVAGFNPAAVDPKEPKRDIQAAVALQHALAQRGDPITLSAALKLMQRVR